MEKKVVSDKNKLFAAVNTECHHQKVSPDSEEHLKVWVKQPTWLQVETALSSVLNIDSKTQNFDLDLNKMYRYMVENFVEKTEPQLSTIDMLRLNPYIGNQLKEILPNPFGDLLGDDEGKEESSALF